MEVGVFDCEIDKKHIFTFKLTNHNMLSLQFVWLGDNKGTSAFQIVPAQTDFTVPKIRFGDEITYRTYLRKRGE